MFVLYKISSSPSILVVLGPKSLMAKWGLSSRLKEEPRFSLQSEKTLAAPEHTHGIAVQRYTGVGPRKRARAPSREWVVRHYFGYYGILPNTAIIDRFGIIIGDH